VDALRREVDVLRTDLAQREARAATARELRAEADADLARGG
jgi:hypothetical protein